MIRIYKKMAILMLSVMFILLAGCTSDGEQTGPNTGENTASPPIGSPSPSGSAMTPTPSASPTSSPVATPAGTAVISQTTGKVTAIRLANPQSGWTGGEGWISRTDDGGVTWRKQYQGKGTIQQIFALNSQDAWATISPDPSKPELRQLLHTIDGGKQWSLVGSMPNGGFLHFVSTDEAFSADARTTDGGKTWNKLITPEQTIGDAYFHDKEHGWTVTQSPNSLNTFEVQATIDGGRTWKTVLSRETAAPINGVVIRSAGKEDAWVQLTGGSGMTQTSYSLFHTLDGGGQWQAVLANSTAGGGPAPGFPLNYNDGPKNTGSKPGPLYVIDPKAAFMGGSCPACDNPNTIGWTLDGGKTWTNGPASFPGYGDAQIAFADPKQGWWIVTDNKEPSVMYTTKDGGATWTKVHSFDAPKQGS